MGTCGSHFTGVYLEGFSLCHEVGLAVPENAQSYVSKVCKELALSLSSLGRDNLVTV